MSPCVRGATCTFLRRFLPIMNGEKPVPHPYFTCSIVFNYKLIADFGSDEMSRTPPTPLPSWVYISSTTQCAVFFFS